MTVREITGVFNGLRVQRSVAGKPVVKNYSFRIPVRKGGATTWRDATESERGRLMALATQYDARLALTQKAQKVVKPFEPYNSQTNTGVRGITYGVQNDGEGYAVEAFWLRVRHNGVQRTAVARLSRREWSEGWSMIVERLAEIKELDASVQTGLLAACPSESKLRLQPTESSK